MEESERRWWVEIVAPRVHSGFSLEDISKYHDKIKDWLTKNAPPESWESSCTISLGTGKTTIDVYFNEDGEAAAVACKLMWT